MEMLTPTHQIHNSVIDILFNGGGRGAKMTPPPVMARVGRRSSKVKKPHYFG